MGRGKLGVAGMQKFLLEEIEKVRNLLKAPLNAEK